jgi:hypothetical protein
MMTPISVAECDDCGKFLIFDPESICFFVLGDTITGVCVCSFCDGPVICEVDVEIVHSIVSKDAKMFSWETGEQIPLSDLRQ